MSKKFFSTLFIFLLFLNPTQLNIVKAVPQEISNIFSEGIYDLSDYNIMQDRIYTVENISNKDSMSLFVLNEANLVLQSIYLTPLSQKYKLVPLKPNYTIIIIGNGKIALGYADTSNPLP